MSESTDANAARGGVLAYLQLFRLPNLSTAVADILMGYLFVMPTLQPWPVFAGLVAASCLLYTAGMVLNDVFDLEQDRRERPTRPLPSGRISLTVARGLGWGMLVAGVLAAVAADLAKDTGGMSWRSSLIALALAVCVVLYDGVFKATLAGPWLMGSCRALNVLLGMSVASMPWAGTWAGFDASQGMIAAGLGLYIVGVTWFARSEAVAGNRGNLVVGVTIMIAGLITLAAFYLVGPFAAGIRMTRFAQPLVWPALMALLSMSIVRRCLVAVSDPTPMRIQVAVKQCILSIIVLDAAVCLAVRAPYWWALAILSLLIPFLFLGRWVYST